MIATASTRYPTLMGARAAVGVMPHARLLVGPPEPVWTYVGVDERPALLLRHDTERIQAWPGDERAMCAGEYLRCHGWRITTDPGAGGILDLFAWGAYVQQRRGWELVGLRRPGGAIWVGRVPLEERWADAVMRRKGQLVHTFAVPDSDAAGDEAAHLIDRVRPAAREEMLVGARIELREVRT